MIRGLRCCYPTYFAEMVTIDDVVRWVLLRAGLYALVAVVWVTGAGFGYSAVTGMDTLAGSSRSLDNLAAWLHAGLGVAILGGGLTLLLLTVLYPFRTRLPAILNKLVLLPFLLLPVLLIDLVGTSLSFTLCLLALQIFYLIVVRLNKIHEWTPSD